MERKRKNKIIIIVAAVLVVISLVIGFFCFGGNKSDKENTSVNWAEDLANAGIINSPTTSVSSSGLNVDFINVGQGDCALISCNGKNMLIDGGEGEYYSVVKEYLVSKGVRYLDIVIATHPHSDHIGGLEKLAEEFYIGRFIMPEITRGEKDELKAYNEFKAKLEDCSIEPIYPSAGDKFYMSSSLEIEILGPVENSDDINDMSLVAMLKYGKTKFLFTGDASAQSEDAIIKSGADLDCDVLKVSHHGSKDSTSDEFLKKASPEFAVISVAKKNEYNHPHKDVLKRLLKNDVNIYRTDEDGNVRFYVQSETSDLVCL